MTDTPAPLDLDALEALEKAATKAPWAYRPQRARVEGKDPYGHNAAFIVALRNAAPALIAEIRALRAERDELRKERDELKTYQAELCADLVMRHRGALARMSVRLRGRRKAYDEAKEELTALRAERDELRKERDEARMWDERSRSANMDAVRALGDYLLVPPDGGEQTLEEGVQSMKDELTTLRAALETAEKALDWYAETVGDCRKITSEGERARNALDRDHGDRANAALAAIRSTRR